MNIDELRLLKRELELELLAVIMSRVAVFVARTGEYPERISVQMVPTQTIEQPCPKYVIAGVEVDLIV